MPRAVDPNDFDNDPHDQLFGSSHAGRGRGGGTACVLSVLTLAVLASVALSALAFVRSGHSADLQNQIALQGQVAELQGQVAELQTQAAELQAAVDRLRAANVTEASVHEAVHAAIVTATGCSGSAGCSGSKTLLGMVNANQESAAAAITAEANARTTAITHATGPHSSLKQEADKNKAGITALQQEADKNKADIKALQTAHDSPQAGIQKNTKDISALKSFETTLKTCLHAHLPDCG